MNRGGLGARSLNIELQNALNPPGEVRIERFGWTFCPGDKVMQIENDYDKEVYNGDLGVVSRLDMEESVGGAGYVRLPAGLPLVPERPPIRCSRRAARDLDQYVIRPAEDKVLELQGTNVKTDNRLV
jgi:ATP-dependent exoDNAse (exonuclease V) alpha subunit